MRSDSGREEAQASLVQPELRSPAQWTSCPHIPGKMVVFTSQVCKCKYKINAHYTQNNSFFK